MAFSRPSRAGRSAQERLPFISTRADISSATTAIEHMTVKTEMGDRDKIGAIQGLIHDHMDVDRLVELVRPGSEAGQFNWALKADVGLRSKSAVQKWPALEYCRWSGRSCP